MEKRTDECISLCPRKTEKNFHSDDGARRKAATQRDDRSLLSKLVKDCFQGAESVIKYCF